MFSESSFTFRIQTDVRFGPGISLRLPEFLRELEFQRLGLVVDAGVTSNSTYQAARELLEAERTVVHEFVNPVAEPDYDYLDRARDEFQDRKIDCLVAFGGGSSLDLAKGISVLLTNPGPGITYRGFNLVKQPGIPVVALPTTAGTGSEVTPNAVFIDRREARKFGINTPLYLPKLAVLDPLLTISCPQSVTVSSGMDALTHALESYVARAATPISRVFSREAFRLVFNTLPALFERPNDVELRARMQLGAFYAGIALPNAGPGPAGAMSYPLGVSFKVPHGLAGAVFLEPVARLNVERGCYLYAELYDLIDGVEPGLDQQAKSWTFCDRLGALCDVVGVPRSLGVFGVRRDHLANLSEQTFALRGAIEQNPMPIGLDDIRQIFENRL